MGIWLHARAINQRIFAVAETAKADRPMGSVRIVDLTSVIMGPFATHILADMRAEAGRVIRRALLGGTRCFDIAQPWLAGARKRSVTTPN
jgi:crotonobetainyl-CoA:carnitine CoA-transferase CaiB-like acyl-CoA transferase